MDAEKEHHNYPVKTTTTSRKSRFRPWRIFTALSIVILVHQYYVYWEWHQGGIHGAPGSSDNKVGKKHGCMGNKKDFDWFAITPSDTIKWQDCFDGQLCARLNLPLDYSNVTVGPKTPIALRMIPASEKENHLGTILINPGGPGGSGTDLVARRGADISKVVGPQFDILGFDPRGTGASTPAQCFDSESQYSIWKLLDPELDVLDNTTIASKLSRAAVEGQRCLQSLGGNGKDDLNGTAEEWGIGRFMGTGDVATDMLQITEKMGQEKLMYWGFSYGTVLGQYFAAMYPDKVGRLIIDGVADGYDYRKSYWSTNLVDTDAVIESFYSFCHQAGPEKCSLYLPTVDAIKDRITNIFETLRTSPLPVPFAKSGPVTITERAVREMFFMAAYAPNAKYPSFADNLAAIESNNQTVLEKFGADLTTKCDCGSNTPPFLKQNEAWSGIACGDSSPDFKYSPELFKEVYGRLEKDSPSVAPMWAEAMLSCSQWPLRAKNRYAGPLEANSTSFPMLILNPQYDTVCPLANAEAVHKRYKGSGLLVQNSYGHCTLAAPSLCTAKAVRAYFVDGKLPEEGTVCEVEELPFVGNATHAGAPSILSAEDAELLQALRGLSDVPFRLGKSF